MNARSTWRRTPEGRAFGSQLVPGLPQPVHTQGAKAFTCRVFAVASDTRVFVEKAGAEGALEVCIASTCDSYAEAPFIKPLSGGCVGGGGVGLCNYLCIVQAGFLQLEGSTERTLGLVRALVCESSS